MMKDIHAKFEANRCIGLGKEVKNVIYILTYMYILKICMLRYYQEARLHNSMKIGHTNLL